MARNPSTPDFLPPAFCATVVTTPICGNLADRVDRVDRKILVQISKIIFTLGTVITGFSVGTYALLARRVFQGIGASNARELAALDCQLALVARNRSQLAWLVENFGAAGAIANAFVADAADGKSINAAVADIRAWAGRDSIVVLFNASVSHPADFARRLIVNADAAQHLVYRLAPVLIATGEGSLLSQSMGSRLSRWATTLEH